MARSVPDLSRRNREEEWMDASGVEPGDLRRSLRFIRSINTLLRYTHSTVSHFKAFSRNWRPGQTIRVLDVATGSADIPQALHRWASSSGFDLRIVGLDRHPLTAVIAAESTSGDSAIRIVRGDATELPFADGAFDYAMTNMFLHHLDDDQVVRVLREMNRVATRGLVAADLLRDRRAYRWINLFTLFSNPIVRNDARVSVAQAFTRDEVMAWPVDAKLPGARFVKHFGHRFALVYDKSGAADNSEI